ncbi:MAG: LCP family protein [Lachnospiraceae bacterium]|nr:LCP family protein [Lachnospiraceae bacterium]
MAKRDFEYYQNKYGSGSSGNSKKVKSRKKINEKKVAPKSNRPTKSVEAPRNSKSVKPAPKSQPKKSGGSIKVNTKPKNTDRKKPRKKKRKISCMGVLLSLLLVVIIIAGGAFAAVNKFADSYINQIVTTPLDESKYPLITVNEDKNMKHYTNIVLFGIDTREENIQNINTRSDSIIIVSINNKTNEVQLTSVYRDTVCSMNGVYTKIAHAYANGGPSLAISTINRNLDLNISQYATVNFKVMANIINAIGGLELEVEADFIADLNKYIKEVNKLCGGDSPIFEQAGTYNLDGNQAVAYARIRHNQNGDFSRANRQRIVLKAIEKKAKKEPLQFMEALKDVLPQIQTNMTHKDLKHMMFKALKYNIVGQQGFPEDRKFGRVRGMSVNVPTTLEENVVELHNTLFGTENYQVSEELSKINQKIIYQSGLQ